jgi:hypothetical protein
MEGGDLGGGGDDRNDGSATDGGGAGGHRSSVGAMCDDDDNPWPLVAEAEWGEEKEEEVEVAEEEEKGSFSRSGWVNEYHLRVIVITIRTTSMDWLRFTYVLRY